VGKLVMAASESASHELAAVKTLLPKRTLIIGGIVAAGALAFVGYKLLHGSGGGGGPADGRDVGTAYGRKTIEHPDGTSEWATVTAPLLLIQGLDDEYGSLLQLDEIARAVPQPSRLRQLRLAACGHSPQRDQPQETLEAIADFLKNIA